MQSPKQVIVVDLVPVTALGKRTMCGYGSGKGWPCTGYGLFDYSNAVRLGTRTISWLRESPVSTTWFGRADGPI